MRIHPRREGEVAAMAKNAKKNRKWGMSFQLLVLRTYSQGRRMPKTFVPSGPTLQKLFSCIVIIPRGLFISKTQQKISSLFQLKSKFYGRVFEMNT